MLLRAYPKAHREKYGPAMAQLFNDQSRDAWDAARNWGVVKLWLWVLPDLVKSSIIEHLAALNERKSMFDKMAALTQPRAVFARVFALVFLPILFTSVTLTLILPEYFASTARILINPNTSESAATPAHTYPPYDPYFIETEFEKMQSEIVLGRVISQLDLNDKWGKKYNNNVPLKTDQSIELIKERLTLKPENNPKLIDITVFSEDKVEAAQIANAIVYSYQNYRNRVQSNAELNGVGTMQNPLEHIPQQSLVVFVNQAMPGNVPVRPNKPLNIILGTFVGIFLASIAGGISVLIASQLRKRMRKTITAV